MDHAFSPGPLPAHGPDIGADELALWTALKGPAGQAAREALFAHHIGFARTMARRRFHEQGRGDLELADLNQLSAAALLEAIDRFDPARGVPFRGFAARRLAGALSDGIAKSSELREQLSARARRRRERITSLRPAQSSPTGSHAIEALAELAVGLALGFMLEGTGLYDDGAPRADAAPAAAGGYDSAAWRELLARLGEELERLPLRERSILRHHYLDDMSFDGLADLLNLSNGRISQLHRAALARLRRALARHGHFSLER